MSELQGLQLNSTGFERHHLRVVGVSVDSIADNATLARTAHLAFPLLADTERRAVDAYGLRHVAGGHEGEDIALSASVLVGPDGVVRWTRVARNFRVRPTPGEILAALERTVPGL